MLRERRMSKCIEVRGDVAVIMDFNPSTGTSMVLGKHHMNNSMCV